MTKTYKILFQRTQGASYPAVYNTWKTEESTMVIQDLPQQDVDLALDILEKTMVTDEILANIQKLDEDPVSMREVMGFWKEVLLQRMSLGCYEVKNGQKNMVALNVCFVGHVDDKHNFDYKGEKWRNVYATIKYIEEKFNAFNHMGLDTLLLAAGLVVKKEFRGKQLGQKLLAAREPLCLSQGIKGTATIFTGIASQKPAARCGFQTIGDLSIRELAEAGLPYPKDDERRVKFMIKKYD